MNFRYVPIFHVSPRQFPQNASIPTLPPRRGFGQTAARRVVAGSFACLPGLGRSSSIPPGRRFRGIITGLGRISRRFIRRNSLAIPAQLVRAQAGLVAGFMPWSPAFLILWAPGGFRMTCYYYRGAYYKAFWADPLTCAVGEPRKIVLGRDDRCR